MASDGTATVKLFAALRDSAGTPEVTIDAPVALSALLADLTVRFGRHFGERLSIAAVMVNGDPVPRDSDTLVPADAEVALLPPFAGG